LTSRGNCHASLPVHAVWSPRGDRRLPGIYEIELVLSIGGWDVDFDKTTMTYREALTHQQVILLNEPLQLNVGHTSPPPAEDGSTED
jgi:hypothetical protein